MRQSKLSTNTTNSNIVMNKNTITINNKQSSQQPTNVNQTIHHQLSYNQLLNFRTTLLHMQYLYSSLNQSLNNQYKNQQNQHKDHLIQCFNLREQLQELKRNNMMRLFIVKLEGLLAIEEGVNQRMLKQEGIEGRVGMESRVGTGGGGGNGIDGRVGINNNNNYSNKKNNNNNNDINYQQQQQQQQQLDQQYTLTPLIDKLLTYTSIKQQEMQHSLCKLYLGNKVMLDLQKTSQSISVIQKKIDQFMTKNMNIIKLYNQRVQQMDGCRQECRQYMDQVQKKLFCDNNNGNNNDKNNSNRPHIIANKTKYEKHLLHKLQKQQQQIQSRIQRLKCELLKFQ